MPGVTFGHYGSVLGLPDPIKGLLFDMDGVLTRTAEVHAEAWKRTFDALLKDRADGGNFDAFDKVQDYDEYVDGKPRFDGVRYGHRSAHSATLSEMYRHSRDEGFGAEVKRRILLGTYALSAGYYDAYYLKAQKVRTLLTRDFEEAFGKVDAIVTPTSPTAAFRLGEKSNDPLAMYLADIFTVPASLAGICGVSVPCGASAAGLPVGMQVLARHLNEGTAFRVARAVEAANLQERAG